MLYNSSLVKLDLNILHFLNNIKAIHVAILKVK